MESSDGTKRSVRLISSTFGRVGEDGQLSDSYTTLLIVDKTTAPTGEVTLTSTPTVLFSSAMNVRGQKVTPLSQRICQEFSSEDLTDFLVSMADDTAGPEMRARFLQVLDTLPVDTEVHGVSIPVVFSPSTPVFHN